MPTQDGWLAQYTGLVRKAAKELGERYKLSRFEDDLIAFGMEGLLEARARFDTSRGTAFTTFAWYYIRGRILDGCRSMGLVARRGQPPIVIEESWVDTRTQRGGAGPAPTFDIANALALDDMVSVASVIFLLVEEREELTPATPEPSPEERAESVSVARCLREHVAELEETERYILEASFFEEQTLDDIAEHMGCSRSWASRLRARALRRLRRRLLRSGDDFLD